MEYGAVLKVTQRRFLEIRSTLAEQRKLVLIPSSVDLERESLRAMMCKDAV
jgi:hypothetical protein